MIDRLYETIGGSQTIHLAIELFYRKVLEDEQLKPFFASTDMAHLQKGQSMFLSMLLGGRIVYTGKDIGAAHAGSRMKGLTDAHFDRFLEHFRSALDESGVQPVAAEQVLKLLETKRDLVVNHGKAQASD